MEAEAEPRYSEIIELSTFSKCSEVIVKPYHLHKENKTVAPVSLNTLREDVSLDIPHHPKESVQKNGMLTEPTSYRRVSEMEEIGDAHYENVIMSTTVPKMAASTDPIIPSSTFDISEIDDTLPLCKRLSLCKRRMRFQEYAYYAMETLFLEVEQIASLDFICLVLTMGILSTGFVLLGDCKTSTNIPVIMIVSSFCDSLANLLSFFQTLMLAYRKKDVCNCRPTIRATRLVTFFTRLYGLVLVYDILPPEEKDRNSFKYCNAYVYWLSFSYFHFFTFTSVTTGLAMVIAAATYCM